MIARGCFGEGTGRLRFRYNPGVRLVVTNDAEALAGAAATLFRERVRATPHLAMAVPAGRTPRRMYVRLREEQARDPVDYSRMHVFSVDELCPPAPGDGYFWRQVRTELLSWANIAAERCHPFAVDAADLDRMCTEYDAGIAGGAGLDVVMLGLGPNGHVASNEPGTPFDTRTRPVGLLPETVSYILTDTVSQGAVCERAVTLGMATLLAAREVIVLVSGRAKRVPLRRALEGPVTPDAPASILQRHGNCTVLADREAVG
jgi:glucosamine-6-phosphate deaminase